MRNKPNLPPVGILYYSTTLSFQDSRLGLFVRNKPNFHRSRCKEDQSGDWRSRRTIRRRGAIPHHFNPIQCRLCETNPICRRCRPEPEVNCAKRTQFPQERCVVRTLRGAVRPGMEHRRGTDRAKRSQFRRTGYPTIPLFHCSTNPGLLVPNKANFPGGGETDGASPALRAIPSFHCSSIPAFQCSSVPARPFRAKRTQLPGGERVRASALWKKGYEELSRPESSEKQSQFSSSARGGLQGISRITPHGVTTNAGPIVPNKANRPSRSRRRRYPTIPVFHHSSIPVAAVRAKQSQFGPRLLSSGRGHAQQLRCTAA